MSDKSKIPSLGKYVDSINRLFYLLFLLEALPDIHAPTYSKYMYIYRLLDKDRYRLIMEGDKNDNER